MVSWFNPKPEIMTFENVSFEDPRIIDRPPFKERRTPIIVNLTDAFIAIVDLQRLMEVGMNIALFRMCQYREIDILRGIKNVKEAAQQCCEKYGVSNWPIATCIELKTCITRTGILEADVEYLLLSSGHEVTLCYDITIFDKCVAEIVFVDNPYLTLDVKPGMEISISQDELLLICVEVIDNKSIRCKVIKSGRLYSLAYVCLRGAAYSGPCLNQKDIQLLKFAVENEVDMVMINYVRTGETLRKAKQCLGNKMKRPIIICGISTEQDLNHYDDILKEADTLMMARDFLPFEMDRSKKYRLMNIQKYLLVKSRQVGKPFYISGAVFKNSLLNCRLDNHEISDVTNAILDGASGFVLKDTYNIDNTLLAIQALNDLCCSIEPLSNDKCWFWQMTKQLKTPLNAAESAVMSCAAVANVMAALVIVLPTVTGRTARALLLLRPNSLIITVSTDLRVTRLLKTYRGVVPLLYTGSSGKSWNITIEQRVAFAIEFAVKRGWLAYGDAYITLQRSSDGNSYCDMVRIWRVTLTKKELVECDDEPEKTIN